MTQNPRSERQRTLYGIQVLRGVAAVLVVFYHATQFLTSHYQVAPLGNFFQFGFSGVHLFFVLSGFIIFWIHSSDIGKPRQFWAYAAKRFIRIYPAYWVALAVLSLCGFYGGTITAQDVYQNLGILNTRSFIDPVCWTLAFEVLFYMMFSSLILNRTLGIILISYWVLGVVVVNLYAEPVPFVIPYAAQDLALFAYIFVGKSFHSYTVLFMLGVAASYAVMQSNNLKSTTKDMVAYASCTGGLLIFSLTAFYCWDSKITNWDSFSITLAFGLGSAMLMASVLSNRLEGILQRKKILTSLGDASYAIYLLHYPFLLWVTSYLKTDVLVADQRFSSLVFFALCALTILVGWVCHWGIERPLLKFARRHLLRWVYRDARHSQSTGNAHAQAFHAGTAGSATNSLAKTISILTLAIGSVLVVGLARVDLVDTSHPLVVHLSLEHGLMQWRVGPYDDGRYYAIVPKIGRFPMQKSGEMKVPFTELAFYVQYESQDGWTTTSPFLMAQQGRPVVWERMPGK